MPIIEDKFLLLVQNYMECKPEHKGEMIDGMNFGLKLASYFVKYDRSSSALLLRYLHGDMYDNISVEEHLRIIFEIAGVSPSAFVASFECVDLKQKYVPSFVNGVFQVYRLILESRDNCRKLYKPGYTISVLIDYIDVIKDVVEGMKKRIPEAVNV